MELTDRQTGSIGAVLEATGLRKGSNNRYNLIGREVGTDRQDVDTHRKQSESNTRGDTGKSGRDTSSGVSDPDIRCAFYPMKTRCVF
jgi:hypothetical protein